MKTNKYLDCSLRHITEDDYVAFIKSVVDNSLPFPCIQKEDGVIILVTTLDEDELAIMLASTSHAFHELYARCLKENIDLILFDIDGTIHSELDEFYW